MSRKREVLPPYAPVGAIVHCAYWGEEYTVLSHNADGTVTVRWHGREGDPDFFKREPRTGTHATPMDRKRDRIVAYDVQVPA